MSISQLVLVSQKKTYSAHSKFSENAQAEKMVDRTGKPVGENSSNAQNRTLLDEQRPNDYRRILRENWSSRTPTKQLEPKKNAEFYMKNYGVSS